MEKQQVSLFSEWKAGDFPELISIHFRFERHLLPEIFISIVTGGSAWPFADSWTGLCS